MLKLKSLPKNPDRFEKLLEFTNEILDICQKLGIVPVLSGSLAVLAFTGDETIQVNDIDLSCKESDFPRIVEYLQCSGIEYRLMEWHVLQLFRGDLKVEFDSQEYWLSDLPEKHEFLDAGFFILKVVDFDYLRQLYQRGLDDTTQTDDTSSQKKHEAIQGKVEILDKASSARRQS
jgi:hypothetical protein